MVIPDSLVNETTILVLVAVVVILLVQYLSGSRSLDKEDIVRRVITVDRRSVEKFDGPAEKSQIIIEQD